MTPSVPTLAWRTLGDFLNLLFASVLCSSHAQRSPPPKEIRWEGFLCIDGTRDERWVALSGETIVPAPVTTNRPKNLESWGGGTERCLTIECFVSIDIVFFGLCLLELIIISRLGSRPAHARLSDGLNLA